jgi:hypothetical protein
MPAIGGMARDMGGDCRCGGKLSAGMAAIQCLACAVHGGGPDLRQFAKGYAAADIR